MGCYATNQKARRAQERREAIIKRLGARCKHCNTKGSKKNKLELDHIIPREWYLRAKSQLGRVRIYEQEEREGKLQVLCSRCNKKKGDRLVTSSAASPSTP